MKLSAIISYFNPKNLWNAIDNRDLSKSISMVIAMLLPIVIGVKSDALPMAIHIALGVVFASFSDTSGSLRLKVVGMFLATILTLSVTFLMSFLKPQDIWIFLPVLGVLIFGISYLSVYGFRASLISFSGLFAIVLSMSRLADSDLAIYTRLILIAIGGIWYISLVLIRHLLFPKSATEYYLAESLTLTAEYLEVRAELIDLKSDRKKLIKDLLDKQNKLTENHETLREILLSRRLGTGKSYYQARRVLVLRQAIDMLELAMANPVNYGKADVVFKNHPDKLKDVQAVLYAMSERLKQIAENISEPRKIKTNQRIEKTIAKLKVDIQHLIKEENVDQADILALKNYWKYQNSQFSKIRKIESLVRNKNALITEIVGNEVKSSYLTKQEYNLDILKDNFNVKSSIFRHSLRIAVVGIIGYGLGLYMNLFNPYWILMTIIIIMRPNYGLTKERFKDRSLGTVIGGVLAFAIIAFVSSETTFALLAIFCYTIGLSMVQRNYKAAAAFITMNVLFIYALLDPEVFKAIQYRVVDTLIGAGLAFLGSWVLWPFWEIKGIDKTLKNAIKADREYLEEIAKYYNDKGEVTENYKLSRKAAFLALSELNASFQRMAQEPRAQHKSLNEVFQIVMLMHSFLASLASLGTYIVHNTTTPASEDFNKAIKNIKGNLLLCEEALQKISILKKEDSLTTYEFDENYEKRLKEIAFKEKSQEEVWENSVVEEAHLLAEQLKWLMVNSHRMAKILKKIKFE